MAEWLVRQPGSKPVGPLSTELVVREIRAGRIGPAALLCRAGENDWRLAGEFAELAGSVFEDAETSVTDTPWFQDADNAGPAAPRPPRVSHLGLPPPASTTLASRGVPPTPQPLVAGQRAYDEVDDEAATRVASPPSEAHDFVVDDETMTRVAGASAHDERRVPRGGVLPTLPMSAVEPLPARLAGGPPPGHAQPLHPRDDILPPTQPFLRGGGFPPPAAPGPGGQPPVIPPGYGPGNVPPPYGPYPPPQPYGADAGGDQGLKALVALIVFLAVALAIVLILLILRR